MSFLDGILGKLAKEHGIDEGKLKEIEELIGSVEPADIAKKVGIPEEVVEKLVKHLGK